MHSGLAALSRVDGLTDVTADGTTLRAGPTAEPGRFHRPRGAVRGAGLTAESVTVGRPSLDDVYLRHVGRSIEVAA